MKITLIKSLTDVIALSIFNPFIVYALDKSPQGKHLGEARFLEYSIEYLEPLGITTANENGVYFKPYLNGVSHDGTVLPENYWGDYAR
ncbi:MAG: hypothetical protein COU46_03250 [Candidatus Niyogibacteria bacterium CG10_big_fil_rev_8_21_14_0_10_42_19]|uniref:Uncharacterized protein n=1 Tax=Candidatus Niyogibacteria bacterium CG10_big_fil_rev_8_21_14_0_10_42_19 TaxID=1974725 RepID=A0A2H0TF20_9BACT|nr:MAG: hypothetical protein COU46_03250 [Candidatus Niyogibacteria bacterium CG10_big_fil_rev_8_21_14_0_10_42_19]